MCPRCSAWAPRTSALPGRCISPRRRTYVRAPSPCPLPRIPPSRTASPRDSRHTRRRPRRHTLTAGGAHVFAHSTRISHTSGDRPTKTSRIRQRARTTCHLTVGFATNAVSAMRGQALGFDTAWLAVGLGRRRCATRPGCGRAPARPRSAHGSSPPRRANRAAASRRARGARRARAAAASCRRRGPGGATGAAASCRASGPRSAGGAAACRASGARGASGATASCRAARAGRTRRAPRTRRASASGRACATCRSTHTSRGRRCTSGDDDNLGGLDPVALHRDIRETGTGNRAGT